jgi:probable rRNA maturation factor
MKEKQQMSVLIENLQDKIQISEETEELVRMVVNFCLEQEKFSTPCEVSITFVDNERIQGINKVHRLIDRATDVLSFPMVDFFNGEIINTIGDFDLESKLLLLGDIILSVEMAKLQCLEYGHSFEREIAFLISHGVFHLLGYDHTDYESEKNMLEKQELVLEKLGLGISKK